MSTIKANAVTGATTNTDLTLTGDGTGVVKLGDGNLKFPDADGSANQIIETDGAGQLSFVAKPSEGATNAEKTNIMLNAFRITVNGGLTVQNMVDGVVDEFEDETGIDTITSTNEIYDTTDDFYTNNLLTLVGYGTGSVIGNLTFTAWGGSLALSADGVLIGNAGNIPPLLASGIAPFPVGWVGKDWGSGVTKTIGRFRWHGGSGSGVGSSPNFTMKLQGSSTGSWSGEEATLYTSTSTATAAAQIIDVSAGINTSTAYRYHRVLTEWLGGDSGNMYCAELQFYEGPGTVNVTLFSNATTALTAPDDANIVIWEEDMDAITLNTDLKAYASRNGGTTYTQITLAEVANLTTGRILTGTVDISGQSSATAMKYKIETLNTKYQKIHAVALQWS